MGRRPHTPLFFRRYPVCLSFPDRKRINTQYTQRIHSPWSGPVDDVNWRAAPPTLSYSLHLFRLTSKEREGGAVFVRSPYSIEYRYSPSPSPSSPFLLYFLLFQKNCVRFVFLFSSALRHHNMPLFSSPRLSIRSLLPQRNLLPPRSPVCISYQSVLYYTTYLYSSKRLLYSNRHSTVFVFRI